MGLGYETEGRRCSVTQDDDGANEAVQADGANELAQTCGDGAVNIVQADEDGASEAVRADGASETVRAKSSADTECSPCGHNRKNSWLTPAANIVSGVLNPMLMPLYSLLLVLNVNAVMVLLVPARTKIFLFLTFLLCTIVVPAISIGLLRALGKVSDLDISRRQERFMPLLITLAMYFFCAFMLWNRTGDNLVSKVMISAVACALLAMAISPFWKISLHMTGIGALFALMLFLGITEPGDFTLPMAVCAVLSGLLASARLWLGCHTSMQVAAGFTAGLVITAFTIILL